MKSKNKDIRFLSIFLLLIFIEQALLGLQGVSMYDEGAFLSSYHWIFTEPLCVEYFFMYYNGLIAGGLCDVIFGSLGYYAFRIINIMVILATMSIVFFTLRRYMPRWIIFLGLTIHILLSDYGVVILHHNWISALLIVSSIYAIQQALILNDNLKKSRLWMLLSGIIIGVNIFTRLPNISLIGLYIVLIPYYLYERDKVKALKLLCSGMTGITIGICCELLLMIICGHLNIFIDNLHNCFFAATDNGSGHNLKSLILVYAYAYYRVFRMIVWWHPYDSCFIAYAFTTIMAAVAFWKYRQDKEFIYILTLALLMAHLHPLGSEGGIKQLYDNSLWLLIPCSIAIAVRTMHDYPRIRLIELCGLSTLFVVYCVTQIRHLCYKCDFDEGPRWEKTYLIDCPKVNTFTQKTYQQELNTLIRELRRYVKPNDYLFCWDNCPLIYYITNTRPFLSCPWTSCIPESNIKREYSKAEKRCKYLPVMLVGKCMPHDFTTYDPQWNNNWGAESKDHRNVKITAMMDFEQYHHYKVVWEDNLFQILIPEKNK